MPILLYHHVSDQEKYQRYAVAPDVFAAQMQLLEDQGYHTITISELADVINSGGTLPVHPIAITFDDGCYDVFQNGFPILQQHGFRATMYIITNTLGSDKSYGYMQEDEINQLVAAGWEIGSHSVTHTKMQDSKIGVGNEFDNSRKILEEKFKIKVLSFSYPFAIANRWMMDQAASHEYTSAVGVGIFNLHGPRSLFYLSRREVYHSLDVTAFQKLLELPTDPTATPTPESTP